jgi:hypothetical protein
MGHVPFFRSKNNNNTSINNNTKDNNSKNNIWNSTVNNKSPSKVDSKNKSNSNKNFSFVKRRKQIIHTTQIYCYDSDDSHYLSDDSQSPVKYTIRKKQSPRQIYNINILSFNFSNILKYAGCFSLLKRNRLYS